jgi:hypothetical protein
MRELQPNVSKKSKPKRRARWTDEEEEKLRGSSEEFGGDGFLQSCHRTASQMLRNVQV